MICSFDHISETMLGTSSSRMSNERALFSLSYDINGSIIRYDFLASTTLFSREQCVTLIS